MTIPALMPAARPALLLFALALAAPSAVGAQETTDTMRLPAEMRSARAALNTAITSFDANAAGAVFADSAVVNFGGEIISGKPAIAQGWLPQMFQTVASIRFGASSYVINDSEIVETGNHYVVPAEGGGEQPGTHITRWRRMPDGAWKVIGLDVG